MEEMYKLTHSSKGHCLSWVTRHGQCSSTFVHVGTCNGSFTSHCPWSWCRIKNRANCKPKVWSQRTRILSQALFPNASWNAAVSKAWAQLAKHISCCVTFYIQIIWYLIVEIILSIQQNLQNAMHNQVKSREFNVVCRIYHLDNGILNDIVAFCLLVHSFSFQW